MRDATAGATSHAQKSLRRMLAAAAKKNFAEPLKMARSKRDLREIAQNLRATIARESAQRACKDVRNDPPPRGFSCCDCVRAK